jgi:predicted transcriptional regulator of viral defense system
MQPIKILTKWLQQHTCSANYLFTLNDLRALCPVISVGAFKALLSRVVKQGLLEKVCYGLYAYNSVNNANGLLLFHAAAHLRSDKFNYISLETVLSDAGIISQIPVATVTIMSSGRSNKISCGDFGVIEFIHTTSKPIDVMDQLIYDQNCRLWRAKPKLAFFDMKKTHRSCDLVNQDMLNESI